MSRTGAYFTGVFLLFLLSLCVSVLIPYAQMSAVSPDFKEESGVISEVYPVLNGGLADAGRRVYVSEGCQSCHTQFVRGVETADIERGWGLRRTVVRDYILEKGAALGYLRLGPDLTNIGADFWRNEPEGDPLRPSKRDANWHFVHLYNPVAIIKESIMPAYRHLFELRRIRSSPSVDALTFSDSTLVPAGYEVVPRGDAKALVSYLSTLERSHPLKEAGPANTLSTSKKN